MISRYHGLTFALIAPGWISPTEHSIYFVSRVPKVRRAYQLLSSSISSMGCPLPSAMVTDSQQITQTSINFNVTTYHLFLVKSYHILTNKTYQIVTNETYHIVADKTYHFFLSRILSHFDRQNSSLITLWRTKYNTFLSWNFITFWPTKLIPLWQYN